MINISNHPCASWSQAQRDAAYALDMKCYGSAPGIHDIPFPEVLPETTTEELISFVERFEQLVFEYLAGKDYEKQVVMIQGEMTFTHALVHAIQNLDFIVVAATTKRTVVENPDGTKTSKFEFCQFREYPRL